MHWSKEDRKNARDSSRSSSDSGVEGRSPLTSLRLLAGAFSSPSLSLEIDIWDVALASFFLGAGRVGLTSASDSLSEAMTRRDEDAAARGLPCFGRRGEMGTMLSSVSEDIEIAPRGSKWIASTLLLGSEPDSESEDARRRLRLGALDGDDRLVGEWRGCVGEFGGGLDEELPTVV